MRPHNCTDYSLLECDTSLTRVIVERVVLRQFIIGSSSSNSSRSSFILVVVTSGLIHARVDLEVVTDQISSLGVNLRGLIDYQGGVVRGRGVLVHFIGENVVRFVLLRVSERQSPTVLP